MPTITNLDELKAKKLLLINAMAEAFQIGDEKSIEKATSDYQNFISESIMEQVKGNIENVDRAILAGRGRRQLTSKEIKFYNEFIANARNEGVITNITSALPETVIDATMDDMRKDHPLLDFIDFTNTSAAIKWVLNNQASQSATWDELNTEITNKLTGAVEVIDLTFCKLTSYMYVTKDMLELGPQWVDAYCRTTLSEALSIGLENGLVDGDGMKKPVGMTRNFTGSFNPSTGYARKTATAVTSFTPASYGALLANLAKDKNNNPRPVNRAILICNPADYFTKIVPATTLLTTGGQYVSNVLPFPTDIVQSVAVPSGHAVLGIAKNYFMGLGTSRGGKLEYSDEYKFLEDLRTYTIRLYGNGRPKDINSFLYLDISNLAPLAISYNSNVSGSVTTTSG